MEDRAITVGELIEYLEKFDMKQQIDVGIRDLNPLVEQYEQENPESIVLEVRPITGLIGNMIGQPIHLIIG